MHRAGSGWAVLGPVGHAVSRWVVLGRAGSCRVVQGRAGSCTGPASVVQRSCRGRAGSCKVVLGRAG